jgi:hypothetical protein
MFGRTTRSMLISLVVYTEASKSLYGHVYILVALLRPRRTRTLEKFQKDHDQVLPCLLAHPFVV